MVSLLLAVIYLCFISLGLPDSLLGAGWPSMQLDLNVPISYAGIISMLISMGTITSSLLSDRLTKKTSPRAIVLISILLTSIGLFGFSISSKFWMLIVFAIPYGLGAGGIDAALNNYVALHFESRHMSWLHCMWGLGALISPYVMSFALVHYTWNTGYLIIAIVQLVISLLVLISFPLWKKVKSYDIEVEKRKPLSIKEIFNIKGALFIFITFFCYCALESTCLLWGSSYMLINYSLSKEVASMLSSMSYIGITLGRAINGFLAYKLEDKTMVRIGEAVMLLGLIVIFLPFGEICAIIGFLLFGIGCGPVYPCIVHSTPTLFGKENSQAIIGFQMAFAYLGCLIAPPIFGLIANHINIVLLPVYIAIFFVVMVLLYEVVIIKTNKNKEESL